MAEHVEVVINIPKYYLTHPQDYTCLAECVRRGIILPEHHGDLIDIDALREDFKTSKKISFAERMDISCIVDHAPTIIEADKGE